MAFIDNGAGNSMAYGSDRTGAHSDFMPSLGGCEAYDESADTRCTGCDTVNPELLPAGRGQVKCSVCESVTLND